MWYVWDFTSSLAFRTWPPPKTTTASCHHSCPVHLNAFFHPRTSQIVLILSTIQPFSPPIQHIYTFNNSSPTLPFHYTPFPVISTPAIANTGPATIYQAIAKAATPRSAAPDDDRMMAERREHISPLSWASQRGRTHEITSERK